MTPSQGARAAQANGLLALLSEGDYFSVEPHLEFLDLPQGMHLSEPGQVDTYCYFPFAGIGSTVVSSPRGTPSETCLFGFEGMSPASALLRAERNPYLVLMQVGGYGARIETRRLLDLMDEREAMRRLFFRWAHVISTQVSLTALVNANHTIEERLSRWILMCHDRAEGDEIRLTHDFLAVMLSVRRPSVTTALHALKAKQLIHSSRKAIVVCDRAGLEAFAGDAYGGSEKEYLRLIAPLVRRGADLPVTRS